MATFHTVKEAAQITGKSPSAIRRLIYPILDNPKHADRSHIEPSVKKATELRLKGENFAWRISEEFVKQIPVDEPKTKPGSRPHSDSGDGGAAAMIEMLRQELQIKNQQIAAQNQQMTNQNEIMKGLSERLREGNILIGSLQKQLALPEAGSRQKNNDVVDVPPAEMEKGSKPAPKNAKPKKGFFGRLFR